MLMGIGIRTSLLQIAWTIQRFQYRVSSVATIRKVNSQLAIRFQPDPLLRSSSLISMAMARSIFSYHTAMVVKALFSGTTAKAAFIQASRLGHPQPGHVWLPPVIWMVTGGSTLP